MGFFGFASRGGVVRRTDGIVVQILTFKPNVNVSWSAVPTNQLNYTQSRPFHPNTSNHAWKPHFCTRNMLICVFQLHCYSNKLEKLKRCVDICLICALHWCNVYVLLAQTAHNVLYFSWPLFPITKVNNQSSLHQEIVLSGFFWLRSFRKLYPIIGGFSGHLYCVPAKNHQI